MNMREDLQEIDDAVAYWELVRELLIEQDALVHQIMDLRRQVNRLHMRLHYAQDGNMQTELPYPDLASDIVRDFSGFAAMHKYKALD